MCLIIFAYKVVPGAPLIVAANRDEWFNRAAKPAAFWDDFPHVVAGRDLQAHGTWLGATRRGRFAALTNYRNPEDQRIGAPSRGNLVGGYLTGHQHPREFLDGLKGSADMYNGFSILVGDVSGLYFYSNRGGEPQEIVPGIHGLSNHLLDTPWPKVTKGCSGLARLLQHPYDWSAHLDLMDDSVPEGEQLAVGKQDEWTWERSLASMRIMKGGYGTRCSTTVRLSTVGTSTFAERSYGVEGHVCGEAVHHFYIS